MRSSPPFTLHRTARRARRGTHDDERVIGSDRRAGRRRGRHRPGNTCLLPPRLGQGPGRRHAAGGGPANLYRAGSDGAALGQRPPRSGGPARSGYRTLRWGDGGRWRNRPLDREDARDHRRPGHPNRRRTAWTAQCRSEESRCGPGTLVPAGSLVVRDLLHRRQYRDQRRRTVLRQVRRHHRLRTGPAGGAGRRHCGTTRWTAPQGRGRAEPDQTVRRQRGHAGSGHRGDAATAAATADHGHSGRHFRLSGSRNKFGSHHHP